MIRICGPGEVVSVAANARRRRTDILVGRRARVTILARKSGVFTRQRESRRLMFLDHVGDLPGLHRMAPDAIGA